MYAAAHRSLSILEILVHLKGGAGAGKAAISTPFYIYAVSFDEALVEELPIASLPAEWNSEPPVAASQSLGDAWAIAARTAVLSVPNVIVPEERNYVLNPTHPRFAELQIASPLPCQLDPRLL